MLNVHMKDVEDGLRKGNPELVMRAAAAMVEHIRSQSLSVTLEGAGPAQTARIYVRGEPAGMVQEFDLRLRPGSFKSEASVAVNASTGAGTDSVRMLREAGVLVNERPVC